MWNQMVMGIRRNIKEYFHLKLNGQSAFRAGEPYRHWPNKDVNNYEFNYFARNRAVNVHLVTIWTEPYTEFSN